MNTEDLLKMRHYFNSGDTRTYAVRKVQLQHLKEAVKNYEGRIIEALHADLHKSAEESYTTEIGIVYAEISHTLANLRVWMEDTRVSTPLALFPSSSSITRDPWGISLIVAPWNYPFQLLIAPLIGAIAGGNCAVLKPSEFAPRTAAVITAMITEHFASDYIAVVNGDGANVIQDLFSRFRFDHIFFTGSVNVGRQMAKMAAEQLIPTTLELGGKSPCIVDKDVNIKVAAARIAWGKFTNAGQTCVAPDYLLVHESVKTALIEEIISCIDKFYGTNPQQSDDYGRIITDRHFGRLQSFLTQGKSLTNGEVNSEIRYIPPTLLEDVPLNAPVMQEEIFGPILPVYSYNTKEEALSFIQQHPDPLALYVFSNNKKIQAYFTQNISFGGGCINNTLVHLGNPELPFGGVGNSGVGQYHGKYSFETFTRPKAVLKTSTMLDPSIKYPPYKGKLRLLKWLLK